MSHMKSKFYEPGRSKKAHIEADSYFPTLSVITVNYMCGPYLSRCLTSIFDVLRDTQFEVWVVDNGSTDGSVAAAQALGKPVNWIADQGNIGFARANNLAAARASGKYLLILNPDTELLRDCVTPLVNFLENRPDVGVVGCHHADQFGRWQPSFGVRRRLLYEFEYALAPSRYWRRLPTGPPEEPLEVAWLMGSFLLLRRSLVQRVGLFDERFFLNEEDVELGDRIRSHSLKVVYHPEQGLRHYGGISKAMSSASSPEYVRSKRLYYRKQGGRAAEYIYCIAAALRCGRDFAARLKPRI